MKKINSLGFIGLGIMGLPMAKNLLKSGIHIYGYNRSAPARAAFAAAGGDTADSIDQIIDCCDTIFICLPSNDAVSETMLQIIQKGTPGTIVADMGSTSPTLIKELYTKALEKQIQLLDCPVSGGESGAVAGTLSIMCGGDETTFDIMEPILKHMGTAVTYLGPSGSGSIAKLANNMMVGAHLSAMAESYAFAVKAGINPEKLFQSIRGGFAQSAVMDIKVPKLLSRDFSASARIEIHMKDIKNALALANDMGTDLPLTQLVFSQMSYLTDHGHAKEDQCAMVKVYEDSMNVIVSSN